MSVALYQKRPGIPLCLKYTFWRIARIVAVATYVKKDALGATKVKLKIHQSKTLGVDVVMKMKTQIIFDHSMEGKIASAVSGCCGTFINK